MRFPIPLLTLAVAAAGCIHETAYVRDDRPSSPAPPPPAAEPSSDYATSDGSYQPEAAPPPPAGSEVASEEVFYSRLSPYGSWTWVAPYGRVWVPAVGYGWRPYYYGQWVLTDWGWTFVSDDPWGWAAYHYGRWGWGMGVGWYWIPGRIWGPAWVSWRYGGGYVGWCPLGPPGIYYGYSHPAWVAVTETHFTRPIPRVAVPVRATAGVVRAAQPLSGPHATMARNGSFGPPIAGVQRATGQAIRPVAAGQVVGRPMPAGVGPSVRGEPMRSPVQARPRAGGPGAPRPAGVAPRPNASPRGAPRSGGPRAGDEPRPVGPGAGGGYAYGAPRAGGGYAAPRAGSGGYPAARPGGAISGGGPSAPAAPSGGGHAPRPHAGSAQSK